MYRKFASNINYNSKTDYGISLDLDETLVNAVLYGSIDKTVQNSLSNQNRIFISKLVDCIGPKGKGEIEYLSIIKRAGLDKFIKDCNDNFRIVNVWSAGKARYVESITDKIFPIDKHPYITYHYEQCNHTQGYTIKELSRMYAENPELQNIVPINKMFIVDDNAYTFERNAANGVVIPKFLPMDNMNTIFNDDGELEKIMNQMMQVATSRKSIY